MQVITINLIAVLLLLAADGLLSLTDIERAMGLKVPIELDANTLSGLFMHGTLKPGRNAVTRKNINERYR